MLATFGRFPYGPDGRGPEQTGREIMNNHDKTADQATEHPTSILDVLEDDALDQAHDVLSDLLEDPDAGNDDIRDAAITVCEALNAHHEKRKAAIARHRSRASIDRRNYDAEDINGQKIGFAAEYECGTIRMQLDLTPSNGLIDLVPQNKAGRAA